MYISPDVQSKCQTYGQSVATCSFSIPKISQPYFATHPKPILNVNDCIDCDMQAGHANTR